MKYNFLEGRTENEVFQGWKNGLWIKDKCGKKHSGDFFLEVCAGLLT
jgi:hypothetical protein